LKPLKWYAIVNGGEAWMMMVESGASIHEEEVSFIFSGYL